MADNGDPSNTSACACDRFDIIRCKEGVPLLTNNDNWRWGGQNPLFAAYNHQWMIDMVNFYSSGAGSAGTAFTAAGGEALTQAEICTLDRAFAAAMGAGAAGVEYGTYNFRTVCLALPNYILHSGNYSDELAEKLQGIIWAAQADGRLDELNWLMDTAADLTGGYQWNWNGQAADGEGHGSAQMNELLNLMHGMRSGGDWNVLGFAIGPDGSILEGSAITEWNDGTGGEWEAFGADDYDAWIQSLNQNIMGVDWIASNTGANSKYQENFDQWWGWIPTGAPPGPPAPTTTIESWTSIGASECGPNEHWVSCDYCSEAHCKDGMICAKAQQDGMAMPCLIENQCVCDSGYARYTGTH